MLKQANPVKEIEQQAAILLEELLGRVASLKLNSIKVDPRGPDSGIDILARVKAGNGEYFLVGEVKESGQPRFAREAINQLKAYLSRSKRDGMSCAAHIYLAVPPHSAGPKEMLFCLWSCIPK